MIIDGKKLARGVLREAARNIKKLKKKKIVPQLAVILVGNDPSSLSYIKQKIKAAKQVKAQVTLHHFKKTPLYQKLAEKIRDLDQDSKVHGIIVQRPLPSTLSARDLNKRISIEKDIDGFLPKSLHTPPLGIAIFKILNEMYFRALKKKKKPAQDISKNLVNYLRKQSIVLIGRGDTGGKPIAETLQKHGIDFVILHSMMENREEYIKDADIIISAVGKAKAVPLEIVKPSAWLIGVGVHRGKKGIVGDYDEKDIAKRVRFYTPTPGGVGPVNVACLILNLVTAAKKMKAK